MTIKKGRDEIAEQNCEMSLEELEYINPELHKPKATKKTCSFDDLKIHVSKLNDLLKDPQLGLSTWCQTYAELMKEISDYWIYN